MRRTKFSTTIIILAVVANAVIIGLMVFHVNQQSAQMEKLRRSTVNATTMNDFEQCPCKACRRIRQRVSDMQDLELSLEEKRSIAVSLEAVHALANFQAESLARQKAYNNQLEADGIDITQDPNYTEPAMGNSESAVKEYEEAHRGKR